MDERPLPNTEDRDTAGYWDAARRGELAVRACTSCGTLLHLPRAYCSTCGSWESEWRVVPPFGTLYSFTTTERELRPGLEPPYTVVLVDLDGAPGARLAGFLPGRPELHIGMPMRAVFEAVADGVVLPQWEPAENGPSRLRSRR